MKRRMFQEMAIKSKVGLHNYQIRLSQLVSFFSEEKLLSGEIKTCDIFYLQLTSTENPPFCYWDIYLHGIEYACAVYMQRGIIFTYKNHEHD